MRCLYIENLLNDRIELSSKEKVNHFTKVLRLKENVEILVINGSGVKCLYRIVEINSNKVELLKVSEKTVVNNQYYHLGLCLTKKDAFEENIRQAVQLGIRELTPIQSDYSHNLKINEKRLKTIMENAYEQSNNPWELKVNKVKNYSEFIKSNKPILFSSEADSVLNSELVQKTFSLVIGPEGGFSVSEINLAQIEMCPIIKMNMPILTATTALPASFGYINALND